MEIGGGNVSQHQCTGKNSCKIEPQRQPCQFLLLVVCLSCCLSCGSPSPPSPPPSPSPPPPTLFVSLSSHSKPSPACMCRCSLMRTFVICTTTWTVPRPSSPQRSSSLRVSASSSTCCAKSAPAKRWQNGGNSLSSG